MALDHSRLGLENKFLENKSGRIFCVRQVYFTKSCQQVWGRVNQPFILFIHHIWGETVPWGAVFIIQTSDRMQYFTILKYKLHSFNIQDDRSTRGLLAKPLKNFQNHLYNGQPVASCGVFEWTLIELHFNIIKNLLCLFFLFNGFITMCNLKKRLIRAAFWVNSCKRCSWTTENKRHSDYNCKRDNWRSIKRNILRWNIYRDNNFHSRRRVFKCL